MAKERRSLTWSQIFGLLLLILLLVLVGLPGLYFGLPTGTNRYFHASLQGLFVAVAWLFFRLLLPRDVESDLAED